MRAPPAANIADEASERLAKKRPAEKLNYTHVRHQGPVGTVEGVWAPRGTLSSRECCVVWNRYALTVCSVSKNPLFTKICRRACVHAARRRRRVAVAFCTLSSRYS